MGSFAYRRRRLVLAMWVLALVVVSMIGRSVGSNFKDSITGGNTESQRAANLLAATFPSRAGDTADIVYSSAGLSSAGALHHRIASSLAAVATVPGVRSVSSPVVPAGARQVSRDGSTAYAVVQFARSGDAIPKADIEAVVSKAKAAASPRLTVALAGVPIERTENPKFGTSEGLGLLAAIVILLLAFGSLIATLLPIVCAVVGVATTYGVLDLLSHVLTVPTFGPELAALVGLGVGIDYALFVVTRYRGALRAGMQPHEAVVLAMTTSGRTVLFAGSTVVLSLLGLFLLGLPFIYGAALGAISAVFLVMLASVTLLPALLGFVGPTVDRFKVPVVGRRPAPADGTGFWWRWSRRIQAHPGRAAGAALLTLLVLAIPFLSLRLAFTDAGTDPASYTTRQAYDLLAKNFGPGVSGPLVVVVHSPQGESRGTVAALAAQVTAQPDVAAVSPPSYNASTSTAVFAAVPRSSPQSSRTSDLVSHLRNDVIPRLTRGTAVTVLVGGATAASIDTANVIAGHLGLVIAFVVVLAALLLVVAFRSLVIPVASVVMTLLSTVAAYGVMVAVFQWGWLGLGIDNGATAPVDPWIPVMLFALLFGLSMDYQVFLTARIREERDRGRTDAESVAASLASTGRVITSAAAIMVCVFGAFTLGDLRILRVFGLAMAVAILLDATLVRMVLMPATLHLVKRANWWFPAPLARVLPDLVHEAPVAAVAAERRNGHAAVRGNGSAAPTPTEHQVH